MPNGDRTGLKFALTTREGVERTADVECIIVLQPEVVGEFDEHVVVAFDCDNFGPGAFEGFVFPRVRTDERAGTEAAELDPAFDRNHLFIKQVIGQNLAGDLS